MRFIVEKKGNDTFIIRKIREGGVEGCLVSGFIITLLLGMALIAGIATVPTVITEYISEYLPFVIGVSIAIIIVNVILFKNDKPVLDVCAFEIIGLAIIMFIHYIVTLAGDIVAKNMPNF